MSTRRGNLADSAETRIFVGAIFRSVERLVSCADGLSADELNWCPPADGANSLYALITHVLGNLEENFLGVIARQDVNRDRDGEFIARGDSIEPLARSWSELKGRINAALAQLPAGTLDEDRAHRRRGTISVREILLVMARHSSLHEGHAELTRDLLRERASIGV